jgi:hypothetical protein
MPGQQQKDEEYSRVYVLCMYSFMYPRVCSYAYAQIHTTHINPHTKQMKAGRKGPEAAVPVVEECYEQVHVYIHVQMHRWRNAMSRYMCTYMCKCIGGGML